MVDSLKVGDARWTVKPCAGDEEVKFVKPWRCTIVSLYSKKRGLDENTKRVYDLSVDAFVYHLDGKGTDTYDGTLCGPADLFEHELDAWRMYKVSLESQMGALNLTLVEACDRIRELLNGGE